MSVVAKPDDLVARIVELEKNITRLQANNNNLILYNEDQTPQSTNSTTYVDLGPTIEQVFLGATKRVRVIINAELLVDSGEGIFVSFRMQSASTSLASDDTRALRLFNGSGGQIVLDASREVVTPALTGGDAFQVIMTIRSDTGANVQVGVHSISAEPM